MLKQFRSEFTEGQESCEKEVIPVTIEDIKMQWSLLWRNRIDDKVRAEGIANKDYSLLFVDRGTVILATKDFEPLNLKKILRLHQVKNDECFDSPPSLVGGYGKFAREVLNRQKRIRRYQPTDPVKLRKHKKMQPKKKGGRGWLHFHLKK
jgi:hypothetical protein